MKILASEKSAKERKPRIRLRTLAKIKEGRKRKKFRTKKIKILEAAPNDDSQLASPIKQALAASKAWAKEKAGDVSEGQLKKSLSLTFLIVIRLR